VFEEACFVDYPGGMAIWNSTTIKNVDLSKSVVYTFESCMDQCVLYNAQNNDAQDCQAVTYSANLTAFTAEYGGNCFLKSARGSPVDSATSINNYALMASAYIVADS